MKENWDIGICGLNCARCPLYLIPDERQAASEVLGWFKSQGWRDKEITVEEFMETNGRECEGCRGPDDKHWSADCHFKKCAPEKGFEHCFECEDLPCEELSKFASQDAPHHAQTLVNLKRMKEIGLERFIAEQDVVCFCPKKKPE